MTDALVRDRNLLLEPTGEESELTGGAVRLSVRPTHHHHLPVRRTAAHTHTLRPSVRHLTLGAKVTLDVVARRQRGAVTWWNYIDLFHVLTESEIQYIQQTKLPTVQIIKYYFISAVTGHVIVLKITQM